MSMPTAGFIDADGMDIGHIHRSTGFGHIMVNHSPQERVGLANQACEVQWNGKPG